MRVVTNVDELAGQALDFAVARAMGYPVDEDCDRLDVRASGGAPLPFRPSTDGNDALPVFDRFQLCVTPNVQVPNGGPWCSFSRLPSRDHGPLWQFGETMLIAACRAAVAQAFGPYVEDHSIATQRGPAAGPPP